ncbi:T9SS type A sorting domain-containing protein [Bizionia sp.]|uniref:T9SS type A sorting domain-containing protein n=1 Tax=Bizionia sp. TaxID=1954480 RepID=UPI003A926EA1
MTKIYLTLLLLLSCAYGMNAQITFQGCTNDALGNQNFELSATGTTSDAGTIRNTYESTPSNFTTSCPAGVCEIRIIWNINASRWEVQLDNDGPINSPNYTTAVLYFNTTPSVPNPPDLTLGTWQDAGFCPIPITTLTGDVQSSTLSVNTFNLDQEFKIYPNPSSDFIKVLGLNNTEAYAIYNIVGFQLKKGEVSDNESINIKNLANGIYLLRFKNGKSYKFIKK